MDDFVKDISEIMRTTLTSKNECNEIDELINSITHGCGDEMKKIVNTIKMIEICNIEKEKTSNTNQLTA